MIPVPRASGGSVLCGPAWSGVLGAAVMALIKGPRGSRRVRETPHDGHGLDGALVKFLPCFVNENLANESLSVFNAASIVAPFIFLHLSPPLISPQVRSIIRSTKSEIQNF